MKFSFIFVFVFLNLIISRGGCSPSNVNWSMIVSLQVNHTHPRHICEGTILSESYILTAAHCVSEIDENLTIVAGICKASVDKIIIHPLWKRFRSERQFDIAILHLSQPFDLSTNSPLVRAHLPPRQNTLEDIVEYPSNGTQLIIIDWNISTSEILQQIPVQTIHHFNKTCSNTIRNPAVHFCVDLYQDRKDDSASPVFQWIENRWEQVGIAAYSENNSPNVFTRIAYFHDWIQMQINNNEITENIKLYQCNKSRSSCGCSRRNVVLSSSTIVENENALPHTWSMIVSISFRSTKQHLCSGTILENSFILTAAHCVRNRSPNELVIKVGMYLPFDNDIIIRQVNGIFPHPNYTNHSNDLAILRLSSPLDVYKDINISQSCLPSKDLQANEDELSRLRGVQLVVTGWNITNKNPSTHSLVLQQAEIYSIENCSALNNQNNSQFCIGQYRKDQQYVLSDTCLGGSFGDPIFQWDDKRNQWIQIGLASHCAMNGRLGVVTNLTEYVDWIRSTLIASILKISQTYQCDRRASCGCSQSDVNITTFGVVQSDAAVEHSWSMTVSIQWFGDNQCTGSILSDSFILTAATCILNFVETWNYTIVLAGISKLNDTNPINRTVDRVYIHPNHSSDIHNLAILHLSHPLPFNSMQTTISKTCVPMENETYPASNLSLVLLGWNRHLMSNKREETLQQMSVTTIDPMSSSCLSHRFMDKSHQFCVAAASDSKILDQSDLCLGAVGGPVVIFKNDHWEQIGIITDEHRCFDMNNVRVVTRLSSYYQWIKQITNSSFVTYSITTEEIHSTSTISNNNAMRNQLQNEFISLIILLLLFT